MIQALDKDISVIPELKDIVNLCQDYPPHNETVDKHTKTVVEEIKKLDYYKNTTDEKRNALLLSAYLHDIGKGPKNKWKSQIMTHAYPDHPADAIPMLGRILTEEIKELSEEDIRIICMLVIYHDIIGDCMKKERDINQIVTLIDNRDDIDMLFTISIADIKAICEEWGQDILINKESFSSHIMELKSI